MLSSFEVRRGNNLWDVVKSIINCYRPPYRISLDYKEIPSLNFEYLFVSDSKISGISLKLLKGLELRLEDILHEKLDKFLPKGYEKVINSEYQRCLE